MRNVKDSADASRVLTIDNSPVKLLKLQNYKIDQNHLYNDEKYLYRKKQTVTKLPDISPDKMKALQPQSEFKLRYAKQMSEVK